MNSSASPDSAGPTRAEFEEFMRVFTHEIRNRLNAIGLEAADLAEQVGETADATRLQQQVRDCAAFLKTIRNGLSTDAPDAEKLTLAQAIATMQKPK